MHVETMKIYNSQIERYNITNSHKKCKLNSSLSLSLSLHWIPCSLIINMIVKFCVNHGLFTIL